MEEAMRLIEIGGFKNVGRNSGIIPATPVNAVHLYRRQNGNLILLYSRARETTAAGPECREGRTNTETNPATYPKTRPMLSGQLFRLPIQDAKNGPRSGGRAPIPSLTSAGAALPGDVILAGSATTSPFRGTPLVMMQILASTPLGLEDSRAWTLPSVSNVLLCYALHKELKRILGMAEPKHLKTSWMDLVWLLFLAGLALLPPVGEYHKQLVLLAIAVLQLFEGKLAGLLGRRGWGYVVLLKILLATLLIDHTGELSINSSYYPIYYLPVFTAALQFEALGTLIWTAIASAAYSAYLYPAMQQYELTGESVAELSLRILFFFLAAVIVNQFATKSRRQTERYQRLAEELVESNRRLERAQAEARRSERLAALGQMSAGLAHEIRNPLGVIKGSAEMLNQKLATADPLSAELAGYISSEVNRLSALVSRFLDFARPLHAHTSPQEVTSVMDRVLKTVADQWKGGPVRVTKNYAPDLPLAMVDEGLCEQVFVNLIQNAYEAMGEKGGELEVDINAVRYDVRNGIQVRVHDSGPGIPEELREQIFNPFFTTKKTGVGLGLSIVSKIMDEHHGSIRVDTSETNGTGFLLYFPAATPLVENEVAAT